MDTKGCLFIGLLVVCLGNGILAQSCAGNKTFRTCPCGEGTCTDPSYGCGSDCALPDGCYCSIGRVRNEDGACISLEDCPVPECPPNQQHTFCGTCEPTCKHRVIENCLAACFRPGCYCVKDTFRNEDGDCVTADECPYRPCPPNEVYVDCGTCEPTCDNPVPEACPDYCHPHRCYCVPGTVRDQQGDCITMDQCPR